MLPPDQLTNIFNNLILPQELPPTIPRSPSQPPLAVLAVGQTGAGKTRLAPALLSALAAAGRHPAHLIADTYKTYHPDFARLGSPAASDDARAWLAMAAEEAAAARRRVDVLVESACRHPDDFASLVAIFCRAGYRVEVAVLAVPAGLSRLGILTRFYERLPESRSRNLPVRLTPAQVHDASYEGLLAAAEFLDKSAMADVVVVVRRGNLVAACSQKKRRGDDEASTENGGGGGVFAAVQRERARPLTAQETKIAMDDIKRLSTIDEAAPQLDVVTSLLEPLMNQVAHHGETSSYAELSPLIYEQGDRQCSGLFAV